MPTTTSQVIGFSDVQIGDYVVVSNPHRSRFAIKVERIGERDGRRTYLVGKVFSIATFNRESLVAFNGSSKVASLRPTTTIERIVQS